MKLIQGMRQYNNLVVFFIICVIGLIVFSNSLHNSFHFDDEAVIVYNRSIKQISNIPDFFVNPKLFFGDTNIAGHYRPLVLTIYAISYGITGLNPVSYHIANLIFHIGTAFLVFLIVKAMTCGEVRSKKSEVRSGTTEARSQKGNNISGLFAALAAGLIFLVHPFNSEAVNYITALSSIMSGFFYLLAFYCWIKFRSKRLEVRTNLTSNLLLLASNFLPLTSNFYLCSLLAFIAGMLSKEVVITLPIVLWLYDFYFKDIPDSARRTQHFLKWRNYLVYLPFVLIVIIPYFIIRLFLVGKALDKFQRDFWTQMFTELPVLVKHWYMFFVPTQLTPHHYVEIFRNFFTYEVISSALIMICYLSVAVFLFLRSSLSCRIISFFMFFFLMVLLPTTLIPLNTIFQENRGYLAIVSFVVIAGVIISLLNTTKLKWGGVAVLIIMISGYSIYTFQRNRIWKDDITLWSDALRKSPRSMEVYTSLAIAYRRAGEFGKSIDLSKKALALSGNENFFIHDNLGRMYIDMEKWELAAQEFEMAIKGYPSKADSHNELGTAYYRLNKLDKAEKAFLAAIKYDPYFYRPYFNIGVLYDRLGRREEAFNAYKKAIDLEPGHLRSHLNLGILLEEAGKRQEAVEYYLWVVQHKVADETNAAQEAQRRLEVLNQGIKDF